jgi:hypothetical protein
MAMMTQTHGSIGHSFPSDRSMGTRGRGASHPNASIRRCRCLRGEGYAEHPMRKDCAREISDWPAAVPRVPNGADGGAVFVGVVLSTAARPADAVCFARAFNSDVETVRLNLEWYVWIPAIFDLFSLGRVSAITDATGRTGPGADAALWRRSGRSWAGSSPRASGA